MQAKTACARNKRLTLRLTLRPAGFILRAMHQPFLDSLRVLELTPYGGQRSFFALRLSRPSWTAWTPGQFLMLRPASFGLELPLARPFGICDASARQVMCFFQVLGRGTQRMAALRPGDEVSVWGPLGRGFAVEQNAPTLLLAGGMGIAPFVGYANAHPEPEKLRLLFGHREALDCYPVDALTGRIRFESAHERAPEDRDKFIHSARERMRDCAARNGLALACGPLPFLRAVQSFAHELRMRTQLSLENRMACGTGACLGCVAQSVDKTPVCTCREGPVFQADNILL